MTRGALRLVAACSLLVVTSATRVLAEPLLDFTVANVKPAANKSGLTIGWGFSTSVDLLVDGFGLWDADSDLLNSAHEVGLWTSAGTLVANATVDNTGTPVASTSGGQWLFTAVTPFVITAGDYILGAFYPLRPKDTTPIPSDLFTVAQEDGILTIAGVAYTGSASVGSSSLTFPIASEEGGPNGYFGPNLSVKPVPEPASILLLATGLVSAGLARRRSKGRSTT